MSVVFKYRSILGDGMAKTLESDKAHAYWQRVFARDSNVRRRKRWIELERRRWTGSKQRKESP